MATLSQPGCMGMYTSFNTPPNACAHNLVDTTMFASALSHNPSYCYWISPPPHGGLTRAYITYNNSDFFLGAYVYTRVNISVFYRHSCLFANCSDDNQLRKAMSIRANNAHGKMQGQMQGQGQESGRSGWRLGSNSLSAQAQSQEGGGSGAGGMWLNPSAFNGVGRRYVRGVLTSAACLLAC